MKKISIFGAGYVGSVSGACLAKLGHSIHLVDVNPLKVEIINQGRSHIIEPDLDELIKEGVDEGKIIGTTNIAEAVKATDISFICVGTPSSKKGALNLNHIFTVARQIGSALKEKKEYHLITIRSTVLPGTIDKCIEIIEEASGKKHETNFGFCSNPEFLREGTAIKDYFNPPYTLIGTESDEIFAEMSSVYEGIDSPIYQTETKVAELIKYVNNSFHALKVAFGNEVGKICKSFSIDSHKVMDLFCKDTSLNISPYYLMPGFAFGGSCLPKDLKALCYFAKQNDIDVPVLDSVWGSNEHHISHALDLIHETGKKNIGIVGLSFKKDTDDLRESPMVKVVETLLGKGYEIKIYDKNISLAKLNGSNKEYLDNHIPHISKLLVDTDREDELLDFADVFVVGLNEKNITDKIMSKKTAGDKKVVVDFVRLDKQKQSDDNYVGICW